MSKEALDKEYSEALDFLNTDEEEVNSKAEVTTAKINSEGKELLRINNIALEYKYTLEGKSKDESSEKWVQTGRALASDSFIRLTYSMINSYAEMANLVSNKEQLDFYMQYKDSVKKQFVLVRKDRSILSDNKSTVMKLFKDKLLNVGDIICNTNGNMDSVVKGLQSKDDDEDFFN